MSILLQIMMMLPFSFRGLIIFSCLVKFKQLRMIPSHMHQQVPYATTFLPIYLGIWPAGLSDPSIEAEVIEIRSVKRVLSGLENLHVTFFCPPYWTLHEATFSRKLVQDSETWEFTMLLSTPETIFAYEEDLLLGKRMLSTSLACLLRNDEVSVITRRGP